MTEKYTSFKEMVDNIRKEMGITKTNENISNEEIDKRIDELEKELEKHQKP